MRDKFRAEGWVAFRAPASLGVADVVAIRSENEDGMPPAHVYFIEVKATTRHPFRLNFGPRERKRLSDAAAQAGATAWLAWWPSRGKLQIIPESEWPGV